MTVRTALLDAGIPVHTVAQRIGDDPAVLLRDYAKRKRSLEADKKLRDDQRHRIRVLGGHEENGREPLLGSFVPNLAQSSFCSHCTLQRRELSD